MEQELSKFGLSVANPWNSSEAVNVGGFLGLFANPATRKKVVLSHGNTTYPGTTPMSGEGVNSIISIQSVTKMLTGTIFLNRFRHLLHTPVIDTCGVECGIPQAYIDAFFSGDRANITYYELLHMTSGLPNFVEDQGPGAAYNGAMLPPFYARLANNSLGAEMYMAGEDVLEFSAKWFANYPQNRSVYHYSNDNWYVVFSPAFERTINRHDTLEHRYIMSMALEFLTQERLSTLILDLFDEHVPCTSNTVCGLRFEPDIPSWLAYDTSDPGPRTPRNLRPTVTPTSVYYLVAPLGGQWVSGTNPAGEIAGDSTVAGVFPQIIQTQWGAGGAACSVSSLANFMIALSKGMITNASASDFTYSGEQQGNTLLGHSGGGGAGAYVDPNTGIITAGTCNVDPQNGGIAEFYVEAANALASCLAGNSTSVSNATSCSLTPSPNTPNTESSSSDDNDTALYVGIAVGAVAFVGIVVGVFFYFNRGRARK